MINKEPPPSNFVVFEKFDKNFGMIVKTKNTNLKCPDNTYLRLIKLRSAISHECYYKEDNNEIINSKNEVFEIKKFIKIGLGKHLDGQGEEVESVYKELPNKNRYFRYSEKKHYQVDKKQRSKTFTITPLPKSTNGTNTRANKIKIYKIEVYYTKKLMCKLIYEFRGISHKQDLFGNIKITPTKRKAPTTQPNLRLLDEDILDCPFLENTFLTPPSEKLFIENENGTKRRKTKKNVEKKDEVEHNELDPIDLRFNDNFDDYSFHCNNVQNNYNDDNRIMFDQNEFDNDFISYQNNDEDFSFQNELKYKFGN